MDLIDRYLGAVRWNLPAAKADDIVAELADLIEARVEDREEALGRPLRRDEISALLKEFGHPLSVAGRYHGHRTLIGPEVFPFYWFALQIVVGVVVVIEAVQVAGRIVMSSEPFMRALSHGMHGMIQSVLVNAALVTLAFAVIERTGWLTTYLDRWKPEKLPDMSGLRLKSAGRPRRHPQWDALASIGFGIAFLFWWFGALNVPVLPRDADVAVRAGPIWATLFWPVVAVVAARMAYGLVTLLKPNWKPLRAALILGCNAGGLAILAVLHHAERIVVVTPLGAAAAKAADVQASLDKALGIAVIAIALATAWGCVVELWQLYRERR